MAKENNNELEKNLWATADKLRSNMDIDAAEYKHIEIRKEIIEAELIGFEIK